VETHEVPLLSGDRLMLCSDGLTGMVEDDAIASILANSAPAAALWGLIEAANDNGGNDNISVVVIDAH
jgi:serine/threonine protein phosphatase PrpC